MLVYADNAATTKISDSALKAMMPLFKEDYGNPSSLHSIGQKAKEYLENARADIAECINAEPSTIYFTSGGSEADNQALRSAAYMGKKKGKTHIISSKFEHHAILHTAEWLEKQGYEVTYVDVDENGVVTQLCLYVNGVRSRVIQKFNGEVMTELDENERRVYEEWIRNEFRL